MCVHVHRFSLHVVIMVHGGNVYVQYHVSGWYKLSTLALHTLY